MNRQNHTASSVREIKMNGSPGTPPILIIDDESDICYLLSQILRQTGLPAKLASSLSEANDILADNREFSYIFLDNHLPDGLGVNYIKQIKKKCPGCKVIMITAHDNQSDREKASFEGADFFIGKPFSRDIILKTIDKLSA